MNANLTQEVIARQTGDSNLQTQLNSEAALRSALSAEVDTLEENVAYIGANDGSSLISDPDPPQTDTVWKSLRYYLLLKKEKKVRSVSLLIVLSRKQNKLVNSTSELCY